MRFVRRVRWLRVSLAVLLALVGLLSLRLWQWMAYAERQATRVEREEERVEASEQEIDRLNRELKDARTLIHWTPDEIVHCGWGFERATLRPANERLEMILSQEYVPDELRTVRPLTQEELRLLFRQLADWRCGSR